MLPKTQKAFVKSNAKVGHTIQKWINNSNRAHKKEYIVGCEKDSFHHISRMWALNNEISVHTYLYDQIDNDEKTKYCQECE